MLTSFVWFAPGLEAEGGSDLSGTQRTRRVRRCHWNRQAVPRQICAQRRLLLWWSQGAFMTPSTLSQPLLSIIIQGEKLVFVPS